MSAPNNRIDYIEFPAKDAKTLNKTRDFFSETFGWTYQQWGDTYVDTSDSGVTSGISVDESVAPLPVIHTQDIEAAYEKVTSAGGVITKDIFAFPGGKRFHFKDPSGNQVAVWSE